MSEMLYVLIVEDSEDDALLLIRNLKRSEFKLQYQRVQTADEMQAALHQQPWNIILSDYSLPQFSAPAALEILKDSGLDIPFIIISGTIGEATAVASLKSGANDFIIKGNFERLIPAIKRELGEAENRQKHRQAEVALLESEKRYRRMFEGNHTVKLIINPDGWDIIDANPAACKFYGYDLETIKSKTIMDITIPPYEPLINQLSRMINSESQSTLIHTRHRLGSAESRDIELYPSLVEIDGQILAYCIINDVTRRKQAEEELQQKKAEFEAIFQSIPDATIFTDIDHRILMMNPAFNILFGYEQHDLKGKPLQMLYNNWADYEEQSVDHVLKSGKKPYETIYRKRNGDTFISNNIDNIVRNSDGKDLGLIRIIRDISERKEAEKALQHYAERLTTLHQIDQAILRDENPEIVALQALNYIFQSMPVQGVSIATFEPTDAEGTIIGALSKDDYLWKPGTRFKLDQFLADSMEILRRGEILMVDDATKLSSLPSGVATMRTRGLRSYLVVPLLVQYELMGCFSLGANETSAFTTVQIDIIREVADQVAIAIYQTRLQKQIQRHAAELEQRVLDRTTELQQAKDQIENILNSSSDAVILTSFDGVIQHVNPAVENFYGYSREELMGWSLLMFTASHSIGELLEAMSTVVNDKQARNIEIVAQRKDGEIFNGEMALSPITSNDKIRGIVCSIRNITQRKQAEEKLRNALHKEQELNEMKTNFISMVSHDFRTPLTVIQTSTELLNSYLDRMDEERKANHFSKIRMQIGRMVGLLEDVLTINQSEAGVMPFNPTQINLDYFLQGLVDEFQSLPTTKHSLVYTRPEGSKQIEADEKLLQQAMINLMTNAFKYSPEASTVHIDLSFNKDHALIRVRDNGIGIPEADQTQLFQIFHRASNVGAINGTGLGLAIVKRSVEAHGGSVTFESKVDKGTTFMIQLPIEQHISEGI